MAQTAIVNASCDGTGTCVNGGLTSCGNYFCDGELNLCPDKCMSDTQCISNECQGMKCL